MPSGKVVGKVPEFVVHHFNSCELQVTKRKSCLLEPLAATMRFSEADKYFRE